MAENPVTLFSRVTYWYFVAVEFHVSLTDYWKIEQSTKNQDKRTAQLAIRVDSLARLLFW
jgi:hypothetical protein